MIKSQFVVCRAINGVTINGEECLLNDDGSLMLFDTRTEAENFLADWDVPLDSVCIEEVQS